jgi:hypothetical protein
VREYAWDASANEWVKANDVPNPSMSLAIACLNTKGGCFILDCAQCHASMGSAPPSRDLEQLKRHYDRYFAGAELRLAESQRTTAGGLTFTRIRGRLVMEAARGVRYQFPAGARIIRSQSGRPLFVISSGSTPPQLLP